MIGIIPSGTKTYEIFGDFNSDNLIDGKLYYDPKDSRLYYYSKTESRSNPNTGFFPVWNGSKKFVSTFSNMKYFDKDAIQCNVEVLASNIDKHIADEVIYKQRRSTNDVLLKPPIRDGDNMFTQCIKGVICAKNVTIIDLVDMSFPKLDEKVIDNYYSALTKISFMRMDKWNVWLDIILHVTYTLEVFHGERKLISFVYPENKFDTGIIKYDNIMKKNDDPYKKIVKTLMVMENISKASLKTDDVDDYTINNMMTTLNGSKPLSAQLFSRFIRMAGLSYTVKIYEKGKLMFEYRE